MAVAESLPCIVCGRALTNWDRGEGNNPDGAVVATTAGNYGSRVYDSFDGMRLEFNVCDGCLAEAGRRGRVLEYRSHAPIMVEDFRVGHADAAYRPVPWHEDLPDDGGEGFGVQLSAYEELPDPLPAGWHIDMGAYRDAVRLVLAEDQKD